MQTQKFKVEGMTCSGCVRTVATILNNTEGVEDTSVSLEDSSAEIVFNEQQIKPTQMAEKLNKMGYKMHVD